MVEWLTYVDPKKKEVTITSFFFFIIFISMKVIITENRIFNLAKNQLTKKYGNLTPVEDKWGKGLIYYVDDNNFVYFDYNTFNGVCRIFVDEIYNFLEDWNTFNNREIKQVIREWLLEHYNLDVSVVLDVGISGYHMPGRTLLFHDK